MGQSFYAHFLNLLLTHGYLLVSYRYVPANACAISTRIIHSLPWWVNGITRRSCGGFLYLLFLDSLNFYPYLVASQGIGGRSIRGRVPFESDFLAFDGHIRVQFVPAILASHIDLHVLLIYFKAA